MPKYVVHPDDARAAPVATLCDTCCGTGLRFTCCDGGYGCAGTTCGNPRADAVPCPDCDGAGLLRKEDS